MSKAIELLFFSIEELLVWISKFNPDRILDAICRAGRDVWNAWRRFFFGINFDKHEWALNAFMPSMPKYTEKMESAYERILSETVPIGLEDCLEHDFQESEWYREDVFDDSEESSPEQVVPVELAPRGFGSLEEPVEEPEPVYGPHPRHMYEDLSDEEFDRLMDLPHPTTSHIEVDSAAAESICKQRKYNKKNARNQRTKVKPGFIKLAVDALVARLRVRHNITDQGMNAIDEAAMRASASDICASLKINEHHTNTLVHAAAYIALTPDERSIDAVKLAYNPTASARRTLVSTLRKTIWCGGFKSLEDF